jgi:dolichyl-diphosphooligosaccharide--protein glycosyltransferase
MESAADKKIEKIEEQIEKKEEKIDVLEKQEKQVEKQIQKQEKQVDALKKKEEELKSEEKIEFDFRKIKRIFENKNLIKYSFILLILIPLFCSVYFRMQPAYLTVMDEFAMQNVLGNLQAHIADEIRAESPNLPPQTLQKEVERRLEAEITANRNEIEEAVKIIAAGFRQRLQDDDNQTYLVAIDPYAYYRQARNVLEKGHVGDLLVNDSPYNNHMLAPIGRYETASLHPYFGAFLYKILHPITGKSLMAIFFLIPVIVSALAVIPAFFIGRKVGGNLGGFVSSFLVAVHAAFINRTAAGFSDTDSYNVTMPLFIAWFFLEALQTSDLKKKIIYSSLSAFLLGIFSFVWAGWWYIFDIILATFILYILYYIIINFNAVKKHKLKDVALKNTLIALLVFIIVSGLFISVFRGFDAFVKSPVQPLGFMQYKAVATVTVWPNVYTTVAEQNYAPFPSVVNTMGGRLLFLLSVIGIFLTLFKDKFGKAEWIISGVSLLYLLIIILTVPDSLVFLIALSLPFIAALVYNIVIKNKEIDVKYSFLILIWFLATLYASRQGIRFTLILVPAFAIGIGFCLGKIHKLLSAWLTDGLGIDKTLSSIITAIVLLLFMISPARAGWQTAYGEVPSMDDAWWDCLTYIKENSKDDDYKDSRWDGAIINSWWDFGHWFKAVADRAVTFDGASQNTPMAHWIGKVLLTGNEKEAVGILRMLDCGSNNAFDKLNAVLNDSPKSVDVLYEIVAQDKESAIRTLLKYGLADEQAAEVIKNTHCEPPEDFFITSEDMVSKSGVWAHFGSWDFNKAEIYMTVKPVNKEKGIKILMEDYGLKQEDATKTYYDIQTTEADQWIAPWPAYAQKVSCRAENLTINCGGMVIDLLNSKVQMPKDMSEPTEIVYLPDAGLRTLKLNSNGQYAIALLPDSTAVLMSPELARSMFTILFYYNATGLKHFDLVKQATTLTGQQIYVWKVDWKGY